MTLIHNDPRAFAAEMLEGFVAAHDDRVRAVPGGVLARRRRAGAVAVVIGGGSGHYPAFAGYVGPGLAAGAVAGDVFASPSTQQVLSVARRADAGAGVLLCYGNYAGDVLNFDLAEEQLRSEGIDCRTVVVTDDIASAPAAERERRRGVAGDLTVMKIAGAAADAGWDLDRVAEVARRANARTRSLGVAFGGCTLPGEAAPLFSVPSGRMAVGLGIHGEPGLEETGIPSADGLAELLVDRVLAEAPSGAGARVGVTLNGLGSVTSEELYLLYRSVARRLRTAGLQPVAPLVGDFCTSFDMAGVSLTLVWLDDELEALLTAPCDTPVLRVGEATAGLLETVAEPVEEQTGIPRGGVASAALAARVAEVADGVAEAVDAAAEELGRLDAVAGDGDHGIGMRRGTRAAADAADAAVAVGAGLRTTLRLAADAWADRAGGTSGALWGVLLGTAADALDDERAPSSRELADAVSAGVRAVRERGGAAPGDKTMVDALQPFADALVAGIGEHGDPVGAWRAAAGAAESSARGTAELAARLGRSRTHGDRSIGTPDPGALSAALVARTAATLWEGRMP